MNVNERDKVGQTALMHAAERGRPDMVRLLLEHNADVYACDEDGNNALHWAVRGGYLSDNPSHLLDTLVDAGLYASFSNYEGYACLHQANVWSKSVQSSLCSSEGSPQQLIEWLLPNG